MALRLKLIDRDTPIFLPPDLRDWDKRSDGSPQVSNERH